MASPKFRYIGDPHNREVQPDEFTAFGITFPRGRSRAVDNPQTVMKLRGNSHFKEEKARESKAKPAEETPTEAPAAEASAPKAKKKSKKKG